MRLSPEIIPCGNEPTVPVSITVAQFEKHYENRLILEDVCGRKAILDFATGSVQVLQGESLIGELRCQSDPVLLMMDHTLHYSQAQDPEPMFYHEHKASVEVVEAMLTAEP